MKHLFINNNNNKHLWSAYYVLGTVLSPGHTNTSKKKGKQSLPWNERRQHMKGNRKGSGREGAFGEAWKTEESRAESKEE